MKKNPLDWKCYNFALGLVNEKLEKEKRWKADTAAQLSTALSKELKKVVQDFFKTEKIMEFLIK